MKAIKDLTIKLKKIVSLTTFFGLPLWFLILYFSVCSYCMMVAIIILIKLY